LKRRKRNEKRKNSRRIYPKNQAEIQELGMRITDIMEKGGINILKFEARYTSEKTISITWEGKR
jgi:hypothetical protein